MIDPDPIDAAQRSARRTRAVPTDKVCAVCGEQRRPLLEKHHPPGRANDAQLTVWLCLNCHTAESLLQRGVGIDLAEDPDRTMPERLVSVLRGIAQFLERLALTLCSWADALAAFLTELDRLWPEWRTRPTAITRPDFST